MKTSVFVLVILFAAGLRVGASERFVSTTGVVQKEIAADRVFLSARVRTVEKTIEASTARLDQILADFMAEVRRLGLPTNAVTVKSRAVGRETEWQDSSRRRVPIGYAAIANLSVRLESVAKYPDLMTYMGLREEFDVPWVELTSSQEGETRRQAIVQALQAARAKAEALAQEAGAKVGPLLEVTEEEVEVREYSSHPASANSRDPYEGEGLYPIAVSAKVRAKFALK